MEIEIKFNVMQDGIGIATKPDAVGDLITTVTIKSTQIDSGTQARIVNLLKQKCPLYIKIGSDQAQFDLFAVGVKTQAGMDILKKVSETGEYSEEEVAGARALGEPL